MVILLIAVFVLQFAGASIGAHQLHAGNDVEESENHPHLQFSAPVITLVQCVDCVCPNEQTPGFSAEQFGEAAFKAGVSTASASGHSHLVQTTEIQNFDLCLDCHCHGGHLALMPHLSSPKVVALALTYTPADLGYFPPEQFPKYRPPIV
ncbi:hypothetical protein L9G16_11745 [Shewanella sp. A25]|nr:hypothetical protein [Shewanella shenzhenensis]